MTLSYVLLFRLDPSLKSPVALLLSHEGGTGSLTI